MMSPSSAPSQYDEKHRSVLKKIEKDRKEAQEVRSQNCERFKAARCHRCTVDLVNFANYTSLCAMKLNVSKKFNCILQRHSLFFNKFTSREYYNTLKTTKVNFEKLLG